VSQHLGARLSALIDGELSPAERDRAHAHLAACAACRAEANTLRELKKTMRGLPDAPSGDALTGRLLAIGGPGGPVPLRGRRSRHRGRYLALGIASCAVAGLGVTAFTMGGSEQAPGPRITPPVEMYSVQHAITTGEIPFGGSSSVVPVPQLTGPSQEP
jgi:anti-sigma factor RsiW